MRSTNLTLSELFSNEAPQLEGLHCYRLFYTVTDSNIWYPTADEVVAAVYALVPVLFPNYEGDTPDFQFIDGDRGRGLLESSLARPKPLFGYEKYVTVAEKAAAMIWSITKNHPFSDGNKRAALTTGILFMLFNHYLLLTGQDEAVEMCVHCRQPTRLW